MGTKNRTKMELQDTEKQNSIENKIQEISTQESTIQNQIKLKKSKCLRNLSAGTSRAVPSTLLSPAILQSSRVTINLEDRPSLYNIAKHSVTTMDIHTSFTALQEHHPRTYNFGILAWLVVIVVNAMLIITIVFKDTVYSRINAANLENQEHCEEGDVGREPEERVNIF